MFGRESKKGSHWKVQVGTFGFQVLSWPMLRPVLGFRIPVLFLMVHHE